MLFHGCESMLGRANCIKMQMPDPGNGSDTSVLLDLLSMSTVVNIEQINVKTMKTIRKPTLQADQHCFEYFLIFTPTISEECCLHVVLVFKYFKKKAVTTIVEELLSLYFHNHHFPATSGLSLCFIECQQAVSHHAGSPAVCSGGRLLHLTATV